MSGITELSALLAGLQPALADEEYVFLTRESNELAGWDTLEPFAMVVEEEGLTWIVPRKNAETMGESYEAIFRRITLQVHSSLNAVGLTATVAQALFQHDISANIVAAYYHDHLLVPKDRAEEAMDVLKSLSQSGNH